jgi:hypothetical protein
MKFMRCGLVDELEQKDMRATVLFHIEKQERGTAQDASPSCTIFVAILLSERAELMLFVLCFRLCVFCDASPTIGESQMFFARRNITILQQPERFEFYRLEATLNN